jgi:hypothetical protein
MLPEPIVAEIRAIREQIAADCDYDFHKMCQRGEEMLHHWPGAIVNKEELDRTRGRHAIVQNDTTHFA